MTFSHFAHAPIEELSPVIYEQELCVYQKPVGLWLSVDGAYDWRWWCESEGFGIGPHRHAVSLRPGARILTIATLEEMDAFTAKYLTSMKGWVDSMCINWPKIAQEYSGIIIAPYQWERRSASWYYTWDCASACIWDLGAISEIVYQEKIAT